MTLDLKTFSFELVSPEERLMSEEATMVSVPGEEGDFGVLPNHSALLSTIRPGIVEVYRSSDDKDPARVFIAGGFADVTPISCSILAEEAINVSELVAAHIEATIADLQSRIDKSDNAIEKERLFKRLHVESVKLEAATGKLKAAA